LSSLTEGFTGPLLGLIVLPISSWSTPLLFPFKDRTTTESLLTTTAATEREFVWLVLCPYLTGITSCLSVRSVTSWLWQNADRQQVLRVPCKRAVRILINEARIDVYRGNISRYTKQIY
jgi:hypothetical protein